MNNTIQEYIRTFYVRWPIQKSPDYEYKIRCWIIKPCIYDIDQLCERIQEFLDEQCISTRVNKIEIIDMEFLLEKLSEKYKNFLSAIEVTDKLGAGELIYLENTP